MANWDQSQSKKLFDELWDKIIQKAEDYEKRARQYKPDDPLKLLIIGESPPISDTYFYKQRNLGLRKNSLPAKVFWTLFHKCQQGINEAQYRLYLENFKSSQYFLMDLCPFPLDVFASAERMKFIEAEFEYFKSRLDTLTRHETCKTVLVLPSGSYKELKKGARRGIREKLAKCGLPDEKIIVWRDLEKWLIDNLGQKESEA